MALGKCCCCVDLRTGAIIIAIIGIVGGFVNLGSGHDWRHICFLILQLVASGCLLYGAIQCEKIPTIIYLVFQMISIVLIAIIIILFIVAIVIGPEACQKTLKTLKAAPEDPEQACRAAIVVLEVYIFLYAVALALSTYFWICVYSFMKRLNGEHSSPPMYANV